MFLEVGETDRPRFSLVYSAILGAVSILVLPPLLPAFPPLEQGLSPLFLFRITFLQPYKHREKCL